jgi:hypothetical protein
MPCYKGQHMENSTNSRQSTLGGATRVLAIIGFVALIVIGMWGSVQVARAVPTTLSSIAAAIVSITSIFVPATETITLSAPSLSVVSGTPLTLTFDHNKKSVDGSYAFRYSCADGVSFAGPAGTTTDTIACNIPYRFAINGNTVTVTPVSTANRFVDVEVFVDFTPTGAATPTVTGSTVVTVENQAVSTSPTTVTPTPQKPVVHNPQPGTQTTNTYPITGTGTAASNPNGFVDLAPRVIEIGVIDKTTGIFTASSTPARNPSNGRVAVRFAIENLGTKTSPQFAFNAVLPTYPAYIFSSDMQKELAPGDRIEYTIGFDSFVDASQGDVVINVDPTGGINEKNKTNNVLHYTVYVIK